VTAQYGDIRSVVAESFMPDQLAFAITQFGGAPTGGGLQNRSAAPGSFGIFFKGHSVVYRDLTVGRHASIRMTPRNIAAWFQIRPDVFGTTLRDGFGHYFATTGAGSGDGQVRQTDSTTSCSLTGPPYLTAAFNFPSDAADLPVAFERLRYPLRDENLLIHRFLSLSEAYRGDLHYCFEPAIAPIFYNSNSFVAGLLRAAGVPDPAVTRYQFPLLPHYVGWDKFVPAGEFGIAASPVTH
jgi:hypothetical protein